MYLIFLKPLDLHKLDVPDLPVPLDLHQLDVLDLPVPLDLHQLDVPDLPVPAAVQPAGRLQQSHLLRDQAIRRRTNKQHCHIWKL